MILFQKKKPLNVETKQNIKEYINLREVFKNIKSLQEEKIKLPKTEEKIENINNQVENIINPLNLKQLENLYNIGRAEYKNLLNYYRSDIVETEYERLEKEFDAYDRIFNIIESRILQFKNNKKDLLK